MTFSLAQSLLKIGQRDGLPVLFFFGAVLSNESIGVTDQIGSVGIDDLILVAVRAGKVLGDPGLRIRDPFTEYLADSKNDVICVRVIAAG
nr:hypothetical protein [uncultured Oscillibacter sp.]